jgi:hypothetical protein
LWSFSCQNFRNFSQFLHTRKNLQNKFPEFFFKFFVQKFDKICQGKRKRKKEALLANPLFYYLFILFFFSGIQNKENIEL